jgi:Tfp pilus assembly protein PilF
MFSRFLRLSCAACGLAFLSCAVGHAQPAAPSTLVPATNSAPTAPVDPAVKMMQLAIQKMNANDIDGALDALTQALQLNPHSTGAYVLRASIYCQKKLWAQAEADFKAAAQIAPKNVVLKFNVIEVKFMQKQFDAARPGYVALESDPDMGDFASYEVFLCDLAGGHEALAKKELAAFDKADENPSYYFSNAAWSIAHKNYDDARTWFESASQIYPPRKNAYYAESLIYLNYLPLPKSDFSVPPAPAGTK